MKGKASCLILCLSFTTLYVSSGENVAVAVPQGIIWREVWGGQFFDPGKGIADDALGNIYVTGSTQSFAKGMDCPQGPFPAPCGNLFLLKFDSSGALQWQEAWGENKSDSGEAVTASPSGSVYVAGYTQNFGAGGDDALLLKFRSNGSLVWENTWGGPENDTASGVVVDSSENVYIVGTTGGPGAEDLDGFLLKFNSSGSLLWDRTWSGAARGIALDSSSSSLFVEGDSNKTATDFYSTVFRFNFDGDLIWARTFEWNSNHTALGYGIATDPSGSIYISGSTQQIPVTGAQMILLKFHPNGTLLWDRAWGGTGYYFGFDVAASTDHVYLVGESDPVNPVAIASFDPDGTLLWSEVSGGRNGGWGDAVTTDALGNAIVTGNDGPPPYSVNAPANTALLSPALIIHTAPVVLSARSASTTQPKEQPRSISGVLNDPNGGVLIMKHSPQSSLTPANSISGNLRILLAGIGAAILIVIVAAIELSPRRRRMINAAARD